MKNLKFVTLSTLLLLSVTTFALAAGWQTAVVVTTDLKHEKEGSVKQEGNLFTIKAGGDDIWGTQDQFTYAYQEIEGDFEMVVTVISLEPTNDWAKAGIMARQNLDPGSINVLVASRAADDLITFQRREQPNGDSASERFTPEGGSRPVTIKLTRNGDKFYGGWSKDGGKTWKKNVTRDGVTETPVIDLKMDDPILLGIAVTSHQAGDITTAEVEVVSTPFAVDSKGKLATTWGDLRSR